MIAVFFNLLWRYASHQNRLFSPKTDPALVAFISRQYAYGVPLYLATILIALISPALSLLANIGLAVFFALPNPAVSRLIEAQQDDNQGEHS